MNERLLFALLGLAPIVLGLHHLLDPAAWATPDDEDASRDPDGRVIPRPLWQVRLIGLGMLAFGLLWVGLLLFGPPADEPALI